MVLTIDTGAYRSWRDQADEELGIARILLAESKHGGCCFHCQQAAEMALKALANGLGGALKGHDLGDLAVAVQQVLRDMALDGAGGDEELASRAELVPQPGGCLDVLNQYYIPPRYPDAWDAEGSAARHYSKGMAEQGVSCADEVLGYVDEVAGQLGA